MLRGWEGKDSSMEMVGTVVVPGIRDKGCEFVTVLGRFFVVESNVVSVSRLERGVEGREGVVLIPVSNVALVVERVPRLRLGPGLSIWSSSSPSL